MNEKAERPNVERVLAGLKDFQRKTVEYVFQRLYIDNDKTLRFLIADEVGLGKTLVARGIIAKAINHLWDRVDRIDIIYICSNSEIARQNINRLNITGRNDFALASRITLLPTRLNNLNENKVNFVSFTPGTSFDMKSQTGIKEERALLFWLLNDAWSIRELGAGPLNVLQCDAYTENFRRLVFDQKPDYDKTIAFSFKNELAKDDSLKERFEGLCRRFYRSRKYIPDEDKKDSAILIGDLRIRLARICLKELQPDCIILDEFQRFKHLLHVESEESLLAQELFNYKHPSDKEEPPRTILLSATPYKMYTMSEEASVDDHYKDFLETVKFLHNNENSSDELKKLLDEYRKELFRIRNNGVEKLRKIKGEIETRLRKVMVRTERLSVTEDRDGMLRELPCKNLRLEPGELKSYISLQKISQALSAENTMEYWKSAPYLLNFMDDYDLKRAFRTGRESTDTRTKIAKEIASNDKLVLSESEMAKYGSIDPNNARMRSLISDTIDTGVWRLLWIPPSLPYYQLGGLYTEPGLRRFTKRLIFSSWRVVPKAVAALLSYEAERRMICSYQRNAINTPEARKRRKGLLRFTRSQGRLTGMPVLGLLYPSATLARECDPLRLAVECMGEAGAPSAEEVLKVAEKKIEKLLQKITSAENPSAQEDESWYWAAPILLDLRHHEKLTKEWFFAPNLASIWSGGGEEETVVLDEGEEESRWSDHVKMACDLIEGNVQLGRKPPDLVNVLARMSIAGFGVASLRALSRVTGGPSAILDNEIKKNAAQVAWAFVSLFNSPEATALLRGINRDNPYWITALEYSLNGGIQSVLDEFAHVLYESLGLIDRQPGEIAREIALAIRSAMTLRTSTIGVDIITVADSCRTYAFEPYRMRGHFAVRFGQEKSEDGKEVTRAEQVRDAFNSPFWPFVLATTSIGQEGLDFHPYCHAVIHWNLPTNPVDLEQREGRVHRYKGHAVRKNVATRYGLSAIKSETHDPWHALFAIARDNRSSDMTDLIPYWIFPLENGAQIERYVPVLPLSRECSLITALRRSQAIYRMVFGQARQEDLTSYLLEHFSEEEITKISRRLLIDISP